MKKSQIIKNFNTIISEFLEQIAPNIGHTYFHSFSLLIKINCTEPIQQFIKYIQNSEEPLAEYINTKNEAYFQNTDNHKEYINILRFKIKHKFKIKIDLYYIIKKNIGALLN